MTTAMSEPKEPTSKEIRDAVEYIRGQRNMPTSEVEMVRNEMERENNFFGCLGILFLILFAAGIGALASGYLGSALVAVALGAPIFYLLLQFREKAMEKKREWNELKKKEWKGDVV